MIMALNQILLLTYLLTYLSVVQGGIALRKGDWIAQSNASNECLIVAYYPTV